MTSNSPVGDVTVTAAPAACCAACSGPLPIGRARRYCSQACRQEGYRRRHQPARTPVSLPARRSRLDGTIYQCSDCDQRYLSEQWCPDCNRPCQRLGAGGTCPCCEEIILLTDILEQEVNDTTPKNLPASNSPSTMTKSPRFQGKLRPFSPNTCGR